LPPEITLIAAIDERLKIWRQGDAVLGDQIPFVHLAHYAQPITSESEQAAQADQGSDDPLGTVVTNVAGVAIVTQSCDIVRSCRDRPFVRVATLQKVETQFLELVKKGRRARYAFIPGVADQNLVVDLDTVCTLEKSIIATIDPPHRIVGCRSDQEARDLASALSRNIGRFAFPDDFSTAMSAVQDRILKKHGRNTTDQKGNPTNEGAFLAALREIRVTCAPTWTATSTVLVFYFIFDDRLDIPPDANTIAEALLKRFKPTGAFTDFDFRVVALSEISAATYVSTEPLDLDHLSQPS
jgi:hypothetical protein